MILAALLLIPVLLLWLPLSRRPRHRRIVGLVLFGLIGLTVALIFFFPRGLLEITLAALLLSLLTVVIGTVVEWRALGRPPKERLLALAFLPVWAVAALCFGAFFWQPSSFFPDTDRVLPLPSGLQVAVEPYNADNCDYATCTRRITVAGRPGQSGADLTAEVKRHLRDRDWGHGCRWTGWYLDRTTECVAVVQQGDRAQITLAGHRDNVAHEVTLE